MRLLALVLLQPEREWTLQTLADALGASQSSVHRELERAEAAGILSRNAASRPHRFRAVVSDPLFEPLANLLSRTVGIETELRTVLERPDIDAAVIYGSWAAERVRRTATSTCSSSAMPTSVSYAGWCDRSARHPDGRSI